MSRYIGRLECMKRYSRLIALIMDALTMEAQEATAFICIYRNEKYDDVLYYYGSSSYKGHQQQQGILRDALKWRRYLRRYYPDSYRRMQVMAQTIREQKPECEV